MFVVKKIVFRTLPSHLLLTFFCLLALAFVGKYMLTIHEPNGGDMSWFVSSFYSVWRLIQLPWPNMTVRL